MIRAGDPGCKGIEGTISATTKDGAAGNADHIRKKCGTDRTRPPSVQVVRPAARSARSVFGPPLLSSA